MEQQLANLESTASTLQPTYDQLIVDVTKHAKRIAERNIPFNKFTPVTDQDCQAAYQQLLLVVEKKRSLLKQHIEDSKKNGLTEEQLTEIRENFNYFDR